MSIKVKNVNYTYSEVTAWKFRMGSLWVSLDTPVLENPR